MMERWDLYDSDRNLTGETMLRGNPIPPGRFHLVVHICVFNPAGQMLIQRRQPFKQGWSGMWDVTVGGSAVAGDNSRTAARRELKEEVGIDHDFSGAAADVSISFPDGFDDYFLLEMEPDPASLTLQYEEVAEVKWATKEEIFAMIDEGTFIPYHKAFLEFLFFRHAVPDAGSRGISGNA